MTNVQVGDSVILSSYPSCVWCLSCSTGRPNLCQLAIGTAYAGVLADGTTRLSDGSGSPIYSYLGVGSFGEYVVVQERAAIPMREDAPLDMVALIGYAVATGVGAVINTAQVSPGQSVLVIGVGSGGVGLSTIQGARLASASKIIAVDVRDDKLELAKSVGATGTVNSSREGLQEAVLEITDGVGVDFAFEAIGLAPTITAAYDAVAPGGTAVVVGQVAGCVTVEIDPFVMADREKTLKRL